MRYKIQYDDDDEVQIQFGVSDPGSGIQGFFDLGIRFRDTFSRKKSGINITDLISESFVTIFYVKKIK
jgi:hypothetical protein